MSAIERWRPYDRRRARELSKKAERLERMRARAERCTASYGAEKGETSGDMQALISRIVDMERELEQDLIWVTRAQIDMQEQIDALPDPTMRALLGMRYVDGMPWATISEELHYSKGWLMSVHRKAIRQLREKDSTPKHFFV